MSVILELSLLLSILYQLCSCDGILNPFNIVTDELEIGMSRNYTLNSTVYYIVQFQNFSLISERMPPRIFVKCEQCNRNNSLLVVFSLNKDVMSWQLPLMLNSNGFHYIYKNTERTVCPYSISDSSLRTSEPLNEKGHNFLDLNNYLFFLTMFTSSKENVLVELLVKLEENFILGLNENKTVQITPSTPVFYSYEFEPDNATSVLLHVVSEDNTCLILSIQNKSCPVFDLEENIQYQGEFQTVTRQGGLTITKETFPKGFYVVLVVSSNDKYCNQMLVSSVFKRTKNVVITLSKNISSDEYSVAIGLTLLAIVLFCAIMIAIFVYSMRRQENEVPNSENEVRDSDDLEAPSSNLVAIQDTLSTNTDSSLDETDFDAVSDVESDKNIYRMKNLLYLSDLARKNQSILKKKSELYFWNLLTVSIFYFLPVFQLVFSYQYRFNQTGKEDICYYNFLCAHPLWWFSDFNHMFSNIGYISFGGLFMFLAGLKERNYRKKMCSDNKLYKSCGIPQHFGIFYSMGAALLIEGFLSLCYHICPNHYNFQFDSSFMYVISTLCIIKIYQSRHPDINANAYATFALLAAVIVLGMCGVLSSNLTFWILFTIVHLSTCIYLSLQIYYVGRFKLEFKKFVRWFKELKSCRSCHWRFFLPMFPSRFALLVGANLCNLGLAVGSFVYNIKNFSSYLLIVFMVNLLLYIGFYIVMKYICKEKLPFQSIIYILLAMLCWSAALYFFFSKTTSWRLTPSESKLYNQKCKLLDFYDNHDIWHFISAAAMFFSLMVLLTLDDDLTYVERSKIVAF